MNENPNDFDFVTINEEPEDFLISKEPEHTHFMNKKSNNLVINEEAINSFDSESETDLIESRDDELFQNEAEPPSLFSGKRFDTWEACELVLRRRTYLCDHSGFYESNIEKNTNTKKMQCPFHINVSCLKVNNIESSILINKIEDSHNHLLDQGRIMFEDRKQFTAEMLADVKFMTENCKFEATIQRKFLENKYPTQTICSKDLYSAIQKFHSTNKSLLNDVAR
ncbi:10446_t:CDS:2, partial [Scutellospora calospora]